jgi:hypothetical protein
MEVKVDWRAYKSVCKECSKNRQQALENDDGWRSIINQIAAEARKQNAPVVDAVLGIACVECAKRRDQFHRNVIFTRCVGDGSFDVVLYAIPRRKAVHISATIVAKKSFVNGDLGKCKALYEAYFSSSSTADAVRGFNRAKTDSYWHRKIKAATRAIYWYEAMKLDRLYSNKYKAKKRKAKKRVASANNLPQLTLQERLCNRLLMSTLEISGPIKIKSDMSYWKFPNCRSKQMELEICDSFVARHALSLCQQRTLKSFIGTDVRPETWSFARHAHHMDGRLCATRSFVYIEFRKQHCQWVNNAWIGYDQYRQQTWIDSHGDEWLRIPILYRPQSHAVRGEPKWVHDPQIWKNANTAERRLMKAYYGALIDTRDFYFVESEIEAGDTGHKASIMSDGLDKRWLEMRFAAKGIRMTSVEVHPVSKGDKFDHESIKKTLLEVCGVIHKMTTAKTSPKTRRMTLEDK